MLDRVNVLDRVDVLDHGFVELIDVMGDQFRVLESARVSTGAESVKGEAKDRKLIDYLWRNGHTSPFESVSIAFIMYVPIFIERQVVRHRTAKMNIQSGRYSVLKCDYYTPEKLMYQDTKNKQMASGYLHETENETYLNIFNETIEKCIETYNILLDKGVAKEQARMCLPLNIYSKMFFTMDLHNLIKFLSKRVALDAQPEIQEYGRAILSMIRDLDNFEYFDNIFNGLLTE